MKFLSRLEKNKTFWLLLGISIIFFLLRLPSLIEPYWYGDEGIYQVIGKSLADGRLLYSEIWDNKPPLLYIIYAIFNGDQFSVRLFSLLTGIITVLFFFRLTILLIKDKNKSIISTVIFTFLFATPILEGNIANAENFMLLPIIIAGIIIFNTSAKNHKPAATNRRLVLAGFLLGLAFILKTVAFFDFTAFLLFILLTTSPQDLHKSRSRLKINKFKFNLNYKLRSQIRIIFRGYLAPFIFGFVLPISIISLYFLINSNFSEFINAVFLSNFSYVSIENELFIPHGLLILKLLLLILGVYIIFLKNKAFSRSQIFILLWFIFSIFNSYFSGRPYAHYTLLLLPSWVLLLGSLLTKTSKQARYVFLILIVASLILVDITFEPNYKKSVNYYENAISFIFGNKDIRPYQEFFDKRTPWDYEIASFIKTHTLTEDQIFIWGDSPQIYSLSNKLPIGKYTASYHINQQGNAQVTTNTSLNKIKPKYIIILNGSSPFPFNLPGYSLKFIINESLIYERSI